jgi:hypothetical protein
VKAASLVYLRDPSFSMALVSLQGRRWVGKGRTMGRIEDPRGEGPDLSKGFQIVGDTTWILSDPGGVPLSQQEISYK